jgi:hypothetical protein
MFWNKYFWPSFVVMLITVILHWVASFEGLYWTVAWYDVMMHFLGGLWVALFGLWAIHTEYGSRIAKPASIVKIILFVLVVGILWEIHELYFAFTSLDDPKYAFDTSKDILLDLLGGCLGGFIYRKSLTR